MMEFTIRRLTRNDWQMARQNIALFSENVPDQESILKFLEDSKNIFLSAEISGEPVGQLIGYILDRWDGKPPMLFLYSIDVDGNYRRQGIATALVEKFNQIGESIGCLKAFVLTNENNLPAMRLYESTGGKRVHQDDVIFVYE